MAMVIYLLCACSRKDENAIDNKAIASTLPQIRINELLASNQTSFQDPDGIGEYDDWIEIYNFGDKAVNIAGLYFSDSKGNPTKYQMPDTHPDQTTIPPGGYLILWADDQPEQGVLHLNYKLSAEGEDIGIYDAEGRKIDEITFGAQKTDVSTGRMSTDSNVWGAFSQPTPGRSNQ